MTVHVVKYDFGFARKSGWTPRKGHLHRNTWGSLHTRHLTGGDQILKLLCLQCQARLWMNSVKVERMLEYFWSSCVHRHCEFLAGGMAELGQTCRISRRLFCKPGRRRDNKMYEGGGAQTDMEGQGKHSGCALLGWESWSRPGRGEDFTPQGCFLC